MKRAVYTLAVPLKEDIFDICVESIRAYSEKIGADFILRTSIQDCKLSDQGDFENVIMEKFYIRDLLKYYDQVLYIDADVFVKRTAPDIFALYPNNGIILYNESMYYDIDYDKHIQQTINRIGGLLKFWPKADNGKFSFYNAGVMLVNKDAADVFKFEPENYFIFSELPLIVDEPYLHYNIIKSRCEVHDLDPAFNAMMYFMGADGHFLHWANVSNRLEQLLKKI